MPLSRRVKVDAKGWEQVPRGLQNNDFSIMQWVGQRKTKQRWWSSHQDGTEKRLLLDVVFIFWSQMKRANKSFLSQNPSEVEFRERVLMPLEGPQGSSCQLYSNESAPKKKHTIPLVKTWHSHHRDGCKNQCDIELDGEKRNLIMTNK